MNVVSNVLKKSEKIRLLAPALLAATLFVFWSPAQALPFTTDITITGMSDFSDNHASEGGFTQLGSYSVTQGGVTTTNTVNGTTVTGGRPLNAALTQTGDGFGISADVSGTSTGVGSEFPMNIEFSIFNSAVSAIYQLTLQFDYSHTVNVNGGNAYAFSEFLLTDTTNNLDVMMRNVLSDTFFGDHKNGSNPGTFGDVVADGGTLFLDLILRPGELIEFFAQYDMSLGVISDPSSAVGSFSGFLSVANVVQVETGAIPIPATLFLLLMGGLGLVVRRPERI